MPVQDLDLPLADAGDDEKALVPLEVGVDVEMGLAFDVLRLQGAPYRDDCGQDVKPASGYRGRAWLSTTTTESNGIRVSPTVSISNCPTRRAPARQPARPDGRPLHAAGRSRQTVRVVLSVNWIDKQHQPSLSHFRDRKGDEIDAVLDRGNGLVAVEAKSGQTVAPDFFPPLARFDASIGQQRGPGRLVRVVAYGGDRRAHRHECRVLPWNGIKDFDWAGSAAAP